MTMQELMKQGNRSIYTVRMDKDEALILTITEGWDTADLYYMDKEGDLQLIIGGFTKQDMTRMAMAFNNTRSHMEG